MDKQQLKTKLNDLLALSSETEWVEFKAARNSFTFDKIGRYFSALSNEANLKKQSFGWLVFGVDNDRKIVGTSYRPSRSLLDQLKEDIANNTTSRITFVEIYDFSLHGKRVVMFQIPAAPQGMPIAWKGHYYGRDGESLGALNIQEIEQIRGQLQCDWSAQVCRGASIRDLDSGAIKKARKEYKKKFPPLAEDVDGWDDITFLNKAKVTLQGKITMTAIILLGKPESTHFLMPSVAHITWVLKDKDNTEKDYEHFGPPFILSTDFVLNKIRNLKYRFLPDNTLFPQEITQYDAYVIREALHNCIAHQDYGLNGKINVIECPDELIFSNLGSFIPKSIEAVIEQHAPQEYYRNQFLATAMLNLNMIDTIGSGIKKMFTIQRERYFPLPDYVLNDPNRVEVRIAGKIIDENYTKLLIEKTNLNLKIVILLDKVQKREKITKTEGKLLRDSKLVEGRHPNYFVSANVAAITGKRSAYIKNRALDKEHYKGLVIAYLKKYSSANRKEMNELLLEKLPDVLSMKQKLNKIRNLLYEMSKKDEKILNVGSAKKPIWQLRTT